MLGLPQTQERQTKCHRLSDLAEIYFLTVLEAGRLRSRFQRGWFLLRLEEEDARETMNKPKDTVRELLEKHLKHRVWMDWATSCPPLYNLKEK